MDTNNEPSTPALEAAGLVYRNSVWLTRRLRTTRSTKSPGLSRMGILVHLQQEGPSTPGALAGYLGLQPQSVTRLLASMESSGLISRSPDEADGRQSRIELTDAGRILLAEDRGKRLRSLARAMEKVLTPAEQQLLRIGAGLMERVAAAVEVQPSAISPDKQAPDENNTHANTRTPKTMEPRVTSITLGVADLTRAIRFYRDGLGFPTNVEEGAPIAFFETNGTRLALFPLDRLAAYISPEVRPVPGQFGGIALTHAVRKKEEVAEVLMLAEKAGGKIVKPAQKVFWGGHSGYFSDPDGYYWEVTWSSNFTFDEAGTLSF